LALDPKVVREYVEANFSLERMVLQHSELYDAVVACAHANEIPAGTELEPEAVDIAEPGDDEQLTRRSVA
jgi:hypothetical protein